MFGGVIAIYGRSQGFCKGCQYVSLIAHMPAMRHEAVNNGNYYDNNDN